MSGVNGAAVSEADRLVQAQAERLAKRAAVPESPPEVPPNLVPPAPTEAAAPLPEAPKLVAHISVSLFSDGRCSVDAPLDRLDLCLAAVQGLIQTSVAHAAERGAEQAVKAYKAQPFMKRAFPRK